MKKIILPLLILAAAASSASAGDASAPAPKAAAPKAARRKAEKPSDPKKVLHEKFAALDVNHDGAIDAAELAAYEKKVVGTPDEKGKVMDEKQAAEVRAAIEKEYAREDAAHDGKVTEAEFDSADAAPSAPAAAPAAK